MNLKELSVDHDYYASDSNYYSRECSYSYETWEDFYIVMGDADVDMNLVYRWDIHKHDDKDEYFMEIFIIGQRKGKYIPIFIEKIEEHNVEEIVLYLEKSWKKLNNIWFPLNK